MKSIITSIFCFVAVFSLQAQFKTIEPSSNGSSKEIQLHPQFNVYDKTTKEPINMETPVYQTMDGSVLQGRKTMIQATSHDRDGNALFWKGQVKNADLLSLEQQAEIYLETLLRQSRNNIDDIDFILVEKDLDDIHMSHLTYQQTYQGFVLDGALIKLHAINDIITRANGLLMNVQSLFNIASISEEQAIGFVKKDLQEKRIYKDISDQKFSALVKKQFSAELVVQQIDNSNRLVYSIDAYANLIARYQYTVDAQTGEILSFYKNYCQFYHDHDSHEHHKSGIEHKVADDLKLGLHSNAFVDGPATANAVDLQNKTRLINTYLVGSTYYLIDASRPMFQNGASNMPDEPSGVIWTIDAFNTSPENNNFNYDHIKSGTNTWNNKTSVSAHYNGGEAFEYFKNTYARNSINGEGGNIISLINITDANGNDFDNAFWNGQAMFYGNGKDLFTPLAEALDVAGHEMSHGVVQATANLAYQGESGALNESFADIFGTMIDRDDWKLGEDVVTSSFPSGALRDMKNPHNGGNQLGDIGWQPKHTNEQYLGSADYGGVHINSGIPNHAYYLFATAVGKDKAEQVFYRALTKYLSKSSKFIDLRASVEQSAEDLYDATVVQAATDAFVAVGIGGSGSVGGEAYEGDLELNPGAEFVVYLDDIKQSIELVPSEEYNPISVLASNGIKSKPSITDDGSVIIYVGNDSKIHTIAIDWSAGQFTTEVLDDQSVWRNAIISKDGKRVAAVSNELNNFVLVYDFVLQNSETYTLYNPTFTEGVNTGDVDYADAMEFDFSGNYIMYDAQSTIKSQTGADIKYWDIGFLEVFNSNGTFGSGKIEKLFNQLPENTSIGNPSFSKNSPYIIAFDYLDLSDYKVLGANIESNAVSEMFINNTLSYPGYNFNDDKLILTYKNSFGVSGLGTVNLDNTKINIQTNSEAAIIADAQIGQYLANGVRSLEVANKDLESVSDVKVIPNPTSNYLSIESKHKFNAASIFTLDGKLVMNFDGANIEQLQVGQLPSGLYVLKLSNDKEVFMHKLIKL